MSVLPDPSTVPAVMKDRDQWIAWKEVERDGRMTKMPVDPNTGEMAATDDPETWADFDTALEHARSDDTQSCGVGFVFAEGGQIAGIDLDKCRDPETKTVEPWASEIITSLNSYTEVSPSGTGFHIYVLAIHPGDGNRRSMPRTCDELAHYGDPEIEMYDRLRFFTFTGDKLDVVSGSVKQRHDEYGEIHDEWIDVEDDDEPIEVDDAALAGVEGTGNGVIHNSLGIPLEVIRENDEKLDRLLTELEPPQDGYPSTSEADFATAVKLAWWRFTEKEIARIMRRHRARGKTLERDDYLSRTIAKATMRVGSDYYCEPVSLEDEEYDMITGDATTMEQLRDYIPTCPYCDSVLGDHTRLEFDTTERVCTKCQLPLHPHEVFGQ